MALREEGPIEVNCMCLVATLLAVAAVHHSAPAQPIRYTSFYAGKHLFHMITADIAGGALSPKTVHSRRLTSVWNMISDSKPTVAITGTFFSPRGQDPVADVLVDGNLVSHGSRGTAVGVDWFGNVSIFDIPFKKQVDWSAYQFGLQGAVRVVDGGKVRPNPKAQKFHDSGIWGRASRTGLGIKETGELCLFATTSEITLSELGRAMKSHGIRNGVSLDGGGSTCLYYRGSMLIPPKRKLSNLFVISQGAPGFTEKTQIND